MEFWPRDELEAVNECCEDTWWYPTPQDLPVTVYSSPNGLIPEISGSFLSYDYINNLPCMFDGTPLNSCLYEPNTDWDSKSDDIDLASIYQVPEHWGPLYADWDSKSDDFDFDSLIWLQQHESQPVDCAALSATFSDVPDTPNLADPPPPSCVRPLSPPARSTAISPARPKTSTRTQACAEARPEPLPGTREYTVYHKTTAEPIGTQAILPVLPRYKKPFKRSTSVACLFCRRRKIACGGPPEGSADRTCPQCARRRQTCEYPPSAPRGAIRFHETVTGDKMVNVSVASGSQA